jgi:hypothetical protein
MTGTEERLMIHRPLVIIGAPRSGTTILRRCLAIHPALWHLGGESHSVLEGPFHPAARRWASNRCTAEDARDDAVVEKMRETFYRRSINLNRVLADRGLLYVSSARSLAGKVARLGAKKVLGRLSKRRKPPTVRFLEKTPKNALRVPLLNRLFPDALFIWNRRAPEDNIDSLVAGWRAQRRLGPFTRAKFRTYPIADRLQLRDYEGAWWKFALPPGWQKLSGKTVAEVAAWQYFQCNRYAQNDLKALEEQRIFELKHEAFVENPLDHVADILRWAGLSVKPVVERFAQALPRVNSTREAGTPHGLRYPKQVRQAIRGSPALQALRKELGYHV